MIELPPSVRLRELLVGHRAGDPKSTASLFGFVCDFMGNSVHHLRRKWPSLANEAESFDVLQDVAARLLAKGADLPTDPEEFLRLIRQIAFGICADLVRKVARRPAIETGHDGPVLAQQVDEATSVQSRALRAERNEQIRAAVDRLPGVQRAVVWLRFADEPKVSFREIGDALGISEEMARLHFASARDSLKDML